MSAAARRWTIAAGVVVVAALVVFLGGRALINAARGHTAESQCTFGGYTLDNDQTAIASTMVGVAVRRGLPERASVLSLAAALQESKLQNLASGDGDRDSVGVLQQRPSQGWGSIAELGDVHYATGKFLDALLKVDNWQTEPLADAIQAVQISADGSAYAQHEAKAQALADALTGATPAGLTCAFPKPSTVATPAQVGAAVVADLPVNKPVITATQVQVPGASWATASWFVANADRLGLASVAYAGKQWTRDKGTWVADSKAPANVVVATPGR